eukprot:11954617-Alexandrium_andersonii.AAC.1
MPFHRAALREKVRGEVAVGRLVYFRDYTRVLVPYEDLPAEREGEEAVQWDPDASDAGSETDRARARGAMPGQRAQLPRTSFR